MGMGHGFVWDHVYRGVLEYMKRKWTKEELALHKASHRFSNMTRRNFISLGSIGLPLTWLTPIIPKALGQSTPQRFVQFFLGGGWDTALATDPITGTKRTSGTYDSQYLTRTISTVTGKDNLVMGDGIAPATNAFQSMNTLFINGMYVEVTAHELATKYLLSGRSTLSRSREFPAITALMGDASGEFPPHLNLGIGVPLGDTKNSNPPIHAVSTDHLSMMLSGPRVNQDPEDPDGVTFNDTAVSAMNKLVSDLDTIHDNRLSAAENAKLNAWRSASSRITDIYDRRYDQSIRIDDSTRSRYNITENWRMEANTAAAFLALRAGLTSFITVHGAGYDTHNNHLGTHVPLMNSFANTLNTFVTDLASTQDPGAAEGTTLADTTTILITSEFSRTPTFNVANGTDHWTSASAILMGANVRDNTVIGATDDQALSLGWENGAATTRTDANELNAAKIYAAICSQLGYTTAASTIVSDTTISDAFRSELFST